VTGRAHVESESSERDLLPVVLARDLTDLDADQCWLVEPLWARAGVGILGGAPKCHKSWIGLDLALSVASDTPCLGRFDVRDPGPVLLYLAEDAPGVVKQRLAGLCAPRGLDLDALPIHVVTAPSLRLDLPHDQRRLHKTLAAIRPRLLVLDPFVRLHRIDENSAAEVSAILAFLREVQRAHDAAVLVVHHARKNASSSAGQGLRGSSDFHAWTDSALYVRRRRGELVVTVEHRAAAAPDPFLVGLVITDDPSAPAHLVARGAEPDAEGEAATAVAPDLQRRILADLAAATAPLSREALRAAIRVRNDSLGVALRQLEASGNVERTPRGWRLADHSLPAP
jgi:hypothetical protein